VARPPCCACSPASFSPSLGTFTWRPTVPSAWCRQQSQDQRRELEPFAADSSAAAHRWRGLLDVDSSSPERWEQLSAGERKRWQLAQVLAQEPDVLLLDEPTNHLDETARQLLQQALARFRGVGILVSHDRALLDALTTRTLRIIGGMVGGTAGSSVELCPGNYTASAQEWQARREATVAAKNGLQREQRRVAQRRHAQRERALQANAQRNTSRRMKDANDSDARSIMAQNRAGSAARRLAQDTSALASRLGRIARTAPARLSCCASWSDRTHWPSPAACIWRRAYPKALARSSVRDSATYRRYSAGACCSW
jgi:ATPase subunit of ABC transporter with duplicated ATPase domains